MPSRSAGVISQDWEPIVLNRRRQRTSELRDPKAVNQAIRAGAVVETVKKHDAGSNKKASSALSGAVVNARKLDEQTEPVALDRVPAEVRLAIQKARIAKKLSQVDLAKAICEKPQVVQEYESGKAVPNQAVLSKMERILEVKLRGKGIAKA
ncbi:multiprotein bridging factor 1C [Wolffia australiana]